MVSILDSLPEAVLLAAEPEIAALRPPPEAPRIERDAWFADYVQCRAVGRWGRCRYGVRMPHEDACVMCGQATAPIRKRVASSLEGVPRSAWAEEVIPDDVQLSNKACRRYYVGTVPCRCSEARCWYDAQRARRRSALPALTPEAWQLLLEGEIENSP